jgi:hypothetical protein
MWRLRAYKFMQRECPGGGTAQCCKRRRLSIAQLGLVSQSEMVSITSQAEPISARKVCVCCCFHASFELRR